MNAVVEKTVTTPEGSPSAAPATEPSTAPSAEVGFDFGALATYDEDTPQAPADSGKEAAPVAAPAPPASPAKAQGPIPPVPPVAAEPAVAPPPLPPTEPQAVQPPQAATTPAAPAQVEQLTIEQHRDKFVPQLQKLYELTDAEVEALQATPGAVLPKLAARLHYEVHMAVHQGILQVLPQLIASQMQTHEQSTKYNNDFYGKWPALKSAVAQDPNKEQVIINAISSFRQLNPKASTEDVIARAGLLAMMSLNLPLDLPGQTNGAATPAAPAAPPPAPAIARPPGIGATGHVPQGAVPGVGDEENLISDIVESHLRGDI